MEKVRRGYADKYPGEKSRYTRCENETDCKRRGTPGRHAIWARNQMADAALKSTAAWFLLHFARTATANVAYKRRAQNAGDSLLGDDAAQLVRGYSKQRQIKHAEFSRQTRLLTGNSC